MVKVVDIRDLEEVNRVEHLIEPMLEAENIARVTKDSLLKYYRTTMSNGDGGISLITTSSGTTRSYAFYEVRRGLYGICMFVGQVYSGKCGDGSRLIEYIANKSKALGIKVMLGQVEHSNYKAKCRLFKAKPDTVVIRREL